MEKTRKILPVDMLLLVTILLATASLYRTIVPGLLVDWWVDPNFSHGFVVPIFSAYLVWERRRELRIFPEKDSTLSALALVLSGVLLLVAGKAGGVHFLMRLSIVFLIGGIFRVVFGVKGFRSCIFPLVFLFFMIPIPYLLYDEIAFPLKMLASRFSEFALHSIGVPVFREGNVLYLPHLELDVADACSGIRSLMTLLALAAAVSHIMRLGIFWGAALMLASVPISVCSNSFRIFITGYISYHYGRNAAEGYFHDFSGWMVFLCGALLVFSTGLLLRMVGRSNAEHDANHRMKNG